MPPAHAIVSPVIATDRGDARNVTTSATSSAVMIRRSEVRSSHCASSSSTVIPSVAARAAIAPVVVSVRVAEGDRVTQGEEMLRIDDSLLRAQRVVAEAGLEQA